MLITATYDWHYVGMTARYSGKGKISFNCDPEENDYEKATIRARKKESAEGGFSPLLIEIKNLVLTA